MNAGGPAGFWALGLKAQRLRFKAFEALSRKSVINSVEQLLLCMLMTQSLNESSLVQQPPRPVSFRVPRKSEAFQEASLVEQSSILRGSSLTASSLEAPACVFRFHRQRLAGYLP